jgi:hypothetical protein
MLPIMLPLMLLLLVTMVAGRDSYCAHNHRFNAL